MLGHYIRRKEILLSSTGLLFSGLSKKVVSACISFLLFPVKHNQPMLQS